MRKGKYREIKKTFPRLYNQYRLKTVFEPSGQFPETATKYGQK
jgi:hypothetical protein